MDERLPVGVLGAGEGQLVRLGEGHVHFGGVEHVARGTLVGDLLEIVDRGRGRLTAFGRRHPGTADPGPVVSPQD